MILVQVSPRTTAPFRLNTRQIQSLMRPRTEGGTPLMINVEQLTHLYPEEQSRIEPDASPSPFVLTPGQIAQLIDQDQLDIQQLCTIEEHYLKEDTIDQPFMFSPAQWSYLISPSHRSEQVTPTTAGLSVSQLIGLVAWQQQSNQESPLKLSMAQIERLAHRQSVFHSFHTSISHFGCD